MILRFERLWGRFLLTNAVLIKKNVDRKNFTNDDRDNFRFPEIAKTISDNLVSIVIISLSQWPALSKWSNLSINVGFEFERPRSSSNISRDERSGQAGD